MGIFRFSRYFVNTGIGFLTPNHNNYIAVCYKINMQVFMSSVSFEFPEIKIDICTNEQIKTLKICFAR